MIFVLSKLDRWKMFVKCIELFTKFPCSRVPIADIFQTKKRRKRQVSCVEHGAVPCIVNVSSVSRLRATSTSTTTTPPSGATTPTRTRRRGTVTPVTQWRQPRPGSTSPSTAATTPRRTLRRGRGRGRCPRRSPTTSTATSWPRCPPSVSRNGVQPYIAIYTQHSDTTTLN